MRLRFLFTLVLWLAVAAVGGAEPEPLTRTLNALRMTPADLGFKKDIAESELVLAKSRQFLAQPLALAGYAEQVRLELTGAKSLTDLADWSRAQRELQSVDKSAQSPMGSAPARWRFAVPALSNLPPVVTDAVQIIYDATVAAQPDLPQPDRVAYEAFLLTTLQGRADKAARIPELHRRDQALELQDDEPVRALLAANDKLDRAALFRAFTQLTRAVDQAVAGLRAQKFTDAFEQVIATPLGPIIIGGTGPNVYTNDALLILDLGGDDQYRNSAGGTTNGIAIVIDLAGNDTYVTDRDVAQGAGVFGIGILVDCAGNDTYAAKHIAQGAGFFGCGLLADFDGQDVFTADTYCQGAGQFGAGIVWQRGGDTTYRAAYAAQGYGGTAGVGLVLDESGNDSYFAGGQYPCRWLDGHNFSLAQGIGMGMRPFAGGGVGVLADLAGNDKYAADVYGQGVSYWYSVGLLLDVAGQDTYQLYQYGQGAGIHLSSGALVDWAGDDTYTAHAISQGGAHDYSVGMLIDHAGNDKYTADSTAQGGAINNSFALLLDRAGNDSYTGTSTNQSQAAGHDGGRREYGSIALLLDLAGKDAYSQGWTNNSLWTKPNHGAGWDGECWSAPTCRRFAFSAPVGTEQRQSASKLAHSKVDVRHPLERLLRRATRDVETDEERKDMEAAEKELNERAAEALPYLLTRLDSPNVMVSVKAEQLVDVLGSNAVPVLVAGLQAAGNDDVARRCAFLLARFEWATNALPVVLPLLDREKTRTTALYTLGHLRAKAVFAPAVAALGDRQEQVRLRAAQALGRVGDRRAVPHLIKLLDDPLWDVRYAAEDALVALGAPSRQPLRAAFADASPLARRYVAAALVRLNDPAGQALARVAERRSERN